jgi:signal transduction histidine kinase
VRATLWELEAEYSAALRDYLSGGGEAALMRAYQLGRSALAEGLGVLEMAALHQEALVRALLEMLAPSESKKTAERAAEFFTESLAPFEMTRRGFAEANALLREINRELEHRIQVVLHEYKAAQADLEARKRAEQLKNEFISVVSHELRTPLTSIHGPLGLILKGVGGELTPEARRLLEMAHRNSRRLMRLVTDILDLQKIESGNLSFELRPVAVQAFLQQALDANQGYAEQHGVELALEEAPRQAVVRADPDRLMQVMNNLLSNAAKFSPHGQRVSVSARRRGDTIRVSVRDRGPGIPESFRERVFEKFAQADTSSARQKAGTGLGLSISKAIMEGMGGRIGFEDREGGGASFWFELPELREEAVH